MAAGDALRVSVVGGDDRVDLVVPSAVRVAELLPELVRRLGDGDPLAGAGEVRLSLVGGPPLSAGHGLAEQGVPDGALLAVTAADDRVAPVADDLTEVVAEAVSSLPRPAAVQVTRATLAVSCSLLLLAALGVLADGSRPTAVAAAVATAGLLLAAAVADRRRAPPAVVAVGCWLAVVHAGAAGAIAGLVGAGSAWVVAGTAAALACRRPAPAGTALWAAPVAGAVLLATGVVAELAALPVPLVAGCAVALVVLVGDLVPWLAATTAGLVAPPLGEQHPTVPDRAAVAGAVRRAHGVLLTCTVATGLLLVVLGSLLAGRGGWGLALVLLCCVVAGLRSRRLRVGPAGLPGLLGGLLPLLPVAVAAWWRWPDRHLETLLAVLGLGLVLLLAAVVPARGSARAGRVAEVCETLALVALPPVLLAATGALDVVRELVG